jgi:outer membrane protein
MKRVFAIILLFIPSLLQAQQLLTLRSAIDTTLKNSFDIRIDRNNAEIAKWNNTYGNAGGLPSIGINSTDNLYNNDTRQWYTDVPDNPYGTKGIDNNFSTGIYANMTLFNGFKIIAEKKRLRTLQEQSQLYLNEQIQSKVAAVMIKYYDIVRQQSYLKIIESTLEVSNKKLEVINERDKVGMASGVDIMQAQIDANIAKQNLEVQQVVVEQAKTDLLELMSVRKYFPFTINDSISVATNIQPDSILNCLKDNPQYLIAEKQIRISEQLMKEINAQRYPTVKIDAGYNFALTDNPKAYIYRNQVYGPTAGLTLQIPIFNGNTYWTHYKAAKIEVMNSKLETEGLLNSLTSAAIKDYQSYIMAVNQIEKQQENYMLAGKLVDLVLQNFQLKQATILDVKSAQASFESAAYSLVNIQYVAKLAEIELQSLVFKLKY